MNYNRDYTDAKMYASQILGGIIMFGGIALALTLPIYYADQSSKRNQLTPATNASANVLEEKVRSSTQPATQNWEEKQ